MAYITVTPENLEKEHICCALIDKKGFCGARKKKEWLSGQMENGLVFRKADIRGKVFIEYLPAEHGWQPIKADNYMQINCLWVSGSHKKQGHGKNLIESCIEDAKNQKKNGVVALSSKKKKGFLTDPSFLKKYGFEVCDSAAPYYELYYLPFHEDAPRPSFMEMQKKERLKIRNRLLSIIAINVRLQRIMYGLWEKQHKKKESRFKQSNMKVPRWHVRRRFLLLHTACF